MVLRLNEFIKSFIPRLILGIFYYVRLGIEFQIKTFFHQIPFAVLMRELITAKGFAVRLITS